MKLRLPDGSHEALSHLGSLLGYTYVHEAAHDPDVAPGFVRAYMAEARRAPCRTCRTPTWRRTRTS